jgi:hypothetical protein
MRNAAFHYYRNLIFQNNVLINLDKCGERGRITPHFEEVKTSILRERRFIAQKDLN